MNPGDATMFLPFVTWKHKGRQYLALSIGGNYTIVDEDGGQYGAWQDYRTFRERQRVGSPSAQPIGTVVKFAVYTKS